MSADVLSIFERATRKLQRDMGPILSEALQDPQTIEVVLNEDGVLWQERLGEVMRPVGTFPASLAQAIIETIAGCHGKEVTRQKPLLEAEFPLDGSRFAGQIPPVVSSPIFAIRKRAVSVFSLSDYVTSGSLEAWQRECLLSAVHRKLNILVTGGTGSGKTTFVNAIIREMTLHSPQERLFIIEDTGEIQSTAENKVHYHTTPDVNMTALLRASLRMRPDRILVGEVRGPEALDLLMAWNTGHEGGAATLHANNARAGLDRLALLVSMHESAPKPLEPLIGEAVHVIVHVARTREGRKITEILSVSGYHKGEYELSWLTEKKAENF